LRCSRSWSSVLAAQPADGLADGPASDVDLLIGTNTEEENLYVVPQGDLESTTEADVLAIAARVHADPETEVAAQPPDTPSPPNRTQRCQPQTCSSTWADVCVGTRTRCHTQAADDYSWPEGGQSLGE
jgi:carboxylesterase type B